MVVLKPQSTLLPIPAEVLGHKGLYRFSIFVTMITALRSKDRYPENRDIIVTGRRPVTELWVAGSRVLSVDHVSVGAVTHDTSHSAPCPSPMYGVHRRHGTRRPFTQILTQGPFGVEVRSQLTVQDSLRVLSYSETSSGLPVVPFTLPRKPEGSSNARQGPSLF